MRPARRRLVLAVVVALGIAVVAAFGWYSYLSSQAESQPPKLPRTEMPVSYPETPGFDPYPECPAIRKWLAKQIKDPASVQIVSWEDRHVYKEDVGPMKAGQIMVTLKARHRDRLGGKTLTPWNIFVDPDGRPTGGGPCY